MSAIVLALVCCLLFYPVASQPQDNVLTVPVQSSSSETCGNDDHLSSVEELVRSSFGASQGGGTSANHPCGPGWRQVAFINVTDPATNCPSGFNLTSDVSLRVCGVSSPYIRVRNNYTGGGIMSCTGTTFSTGGTTYTRVCGRIRSYMSGLGGAFIGSNIESQYYNGISLTHGAPGLREHIWTFTTGFGFGSSHHPMTCPCITTNANQPPSFVGNDYFCDSMDYNPSAPAFYPDNPLWDGQGCPAEPDPYACACERLNPPWFTKTLPASTTDDIEMRHCCNTFIQLHRGPQGIVYCSTPFDLVELYVQ